jgi:hypothetical protein
VICGSPGYRWPLGVEASVVSECAAKESGELRSTRRRFVIGALVGSGAVTAGVVASGEHSRADAASAAQDIKILNFLLTLEYLQVEFYRRAIASGALTGELRQFAETVGAQERQHVALLRKTLAGFAKKPPAFVSFHGATKDPQSFRRAALAIEDLGAAAYIGQGANLTTVSVSTAATITAVEARHAAWIRDLAGELPAPRAADRAVGPRQVENRLRALGFTIR